MRALLHRCVVLALSCAAAVGCSSSHDVGGTPEDGGGAGDCQIRFHDSRTDTDIRCAVASSSSRACFEFAECVCSAWNPGAPAEEVAMCAAWETTPRGAITLADFCTETPPARMMLDEAIAGYIGFMPPPDSLVLSDACALTPALLGRP